MIRIRLASLIRPISTGWGENGRLPAEKNPQAQVEAQGNRRISRSASGGFVSSLFLGAFVLTGFRRDVDQGPCHGWLSASYS